MGTARLPRPSKWNPVVVDRCQNVGWLGSRLCEPPANLDGTVCWGLRSEDSAPTPATRHFDVDTPLEPVMHLNRQFVGA